MEHLQSAIDDMLSQILSAEILILGDSNAHSTSKSSRMAVQVMIGCVHFTPFFLGPICLSYDDPSTCVIAVSDVVLQGMELYIPSTVVPIGGKSHP